MKELSEASDSLFRSARRESGPSSDARARIRAAVAIEVAAGAGAALAGATAAAPTGAKAAAAALFAKVAVPLVVAGVVAGVAVRTMLASPAALPTTTVPAPNEAPLTTSHPSPKKVADIAPSEPSSPSPAVRPNPSASPAPSASASPTPYAYASPIAAAPNVNGYRPDPASVSPAPVQAARPQVAIETAAPSEAVAPSPRQDTLAGELAQVGSIEASLRRGDATSAIAEADAYRQRYPQGLLSNEVRGSRIVAQCMRGDSGAKSAAISFLHEQSSSLLVERVRRACGLVNPKPTVDSNTEEPPHGQ
jgi:hypothetical protein